MSSLAPPPGPPAAGVRAPNERVTFFKKLAFGVGGMTFLFGSVGVKSLAVPVYQMTLLLDPALLGVLLALPSLWDAITDPVMGYLSDRTESRWGRRRPYIIGGAICSAFAFTLIWMVPTDWTSSAQAVWFIVTSLLYYTCYTVWAVPYQSLGFEITPNYHERTTVMGFQAFFVKSADLVYPWIFPLAQLSIFATVMQGVRSVTMVAAFGVFVLIGTIPGMFVKERFRHEALPVQTLKKLKKPKFWSGYKEVLFNQAVIVVIVLTVMKLIAGVFGSNLDYYLLVYYVFDGDIEQGSVWKGILSTGYAVMGFIVIVPMAWLARRFDKRATLMGVYGLAVIGGFVKWFVFQPGHTWIILLDPFFNASIWIALGMLVPSMLADVCDFDEWKHGQRREGMIGAFLTWIQKSGTSLAFLISGIALNIVGFNAALGGDQNPEAILGIRLILAGTTSAVGLCSMVVLMFYPLNEKRMSQIRGDLEERRGVV